VLGNVLSEDEVEKLLACLKAALTYSKAKERISDADRLTPLQSAALSTIDKLYVTPRVSSMILCDLAEYSTLALSGSMEATYLALNRASTLTMLQHYSKWSEEVFLYESGAVGQMFGALMIPLKLRYDCPRGRQEEPIWKGSLTTFCKSAALCCARIDELTLSQAVITDIWTRLQQVFQATLCADCSAMTEMTSSKQEEEQIFDLTLLTTIERDVWPYLGRDYVPEACITGLVKAVSQSSILYRTDSAVVVPEQDGEEEVPVQGADTIPREVFAYWCFDLLILLSTQGSSTTVNYKRVAALALPHLVDRVSLTLSQYITDARLRGMKPASRLQDEEVNYILLRLKAMEVMSHSLLVAQGRLSMEDYLSGSISTDTLDISWQLKQSSRGLLYQLYPILCDFILYITPKAGSTMLSNRSTCGTSIVFERQIELPAGFQLGQIGIAGSGQVDGRLELHDARELARNLLELIGMVWK
jgi:hypothetical protein